MGLCVIHNRSLERYSCMATISRQPSYVQSVNLTGAYAGLCLVNNIPLRFVKQHQSEILHLVMQLEG